MKRFAVSFVLMFFAFTVFGQEEILQSAAFQKLPDSIKVDSLLNLVDKYENVDIEKSKKYLDKAGEIAIELGKESCLNKYHLELANYYSRTGELEKSVHEYFKVIENIQPTNQKRLLAMCYNNLGATYEKQGMYEKSMEYLFQALEINENIKDSLNISKSLLNIGLAHFRQENYELSLNYYNQSLKIREALKDSTGIALLYNNIAIVNYYLGDYDNVRSYFEKAYQIYLSFGDLRRQAMALFNIAEVYNTIGQKDKALIYYLKVLDIEKQIKDNKEIISTYVAIGKVHFSRKDYQRAEEYYTLAKDLAEKIGAKLDLIQTYFNLYELRKEQLNFKEALHYYERYSLMNDSLFNENKSKQIAELQTQYETKKKEQEIELLKSEQEIKDLKIKKQRYLTLFLSIGVIFILSFLIFLVRGIRQIRKKNALLAEQKKQITDSIQYASKIQNALLPPKDFLNQVFEDHFIFYQPRDIVSGDFYWAANANNKIIVAAADCTGHGVPGAFMSMLGFAYLNEILNKKMPLTASNILNVLRDDVKTALHQTGKDYESKDGMDIALCIIDKEKMELEFAGAYNPLFLVRNRKLIVLKPDRMPIGIHVIEKESFTSQTIKLQNGDAIYMFSDGYIDQFGGKQGKKYMILPFKELLCDIADYSMLEQKDILRNSFNEWKGSFEQIDDVLVVGIRI